ncbi:MAG: hypothetical protein ACREIB_01410, partial [Pseudomonadota bacterium]
MIFTAIDPAFPSLPHPVEIREAFDEQALKREWDAACADEGDAVSRKQAVLRAALTRWPMVGQLMPKGGLGKLAHSPEMRRFVRDVLGMPDEGGRVNSQARRLLTDGGREANRAKSAAYRQSATQLRRAVVELTTKYKLGADPKACM